MKSSYPGCRPGRCDYIVLKKKHPKRKGTPGGKIKYDKKDVLEIRWCYEYDGWSIEEIQEVVQMPRGYVYNLVNYQVRADIVPKKNDFLSFK